LTDGVRGVTTNGIEVVVASTARGTGIGLGGALVIAGIIVALFWSVLLGVIIALVGLVAFGGFAKDRWY
jgi:hypothetical protein